jgi:hypothetical protein
MEASTVDTGREHANWPIEKRLSPLLLFMA